MTDLAYTQEEMLREEYLGSLYSFAKFALGYKDVNWRTHGRMIEALESKDTRKLIVMPRGTFKSTLGVVAYPLWRLIRDPNERILLDSEVYMNSSRFIREIRAHLEGENLTRLFGAFRGSGTWTDSELTIAQRTKVYPQASISAGGIGTTRVGQHYSVIVGDDYNSANNSGTPEGCEKVINHYRLNNAILEPGGTYIVIGTRYSDRDLIGHILETEVGMGNLVT